MKWRRWATLPPLLLLTSAAPVGVALPDVNNAGQVLATLNDWRAITFILMFLLIASVVERIWGSGSFSRASAKEAERFAVALEKVADAVEASSRTHTAELHLLRANMEVLLDRKGRVP